MAKKLSSSKKHHARVFIIIIFSILYVSIVGTLTDSLMKYLFNFGVSDSSINFGIIFMLYVCWVTNVRWGWVENFIEGKKKYPHMSIWFERVYG